MFIIEQNYYRVRGYIFAIIYLWKLMKTLSLLFNYRKRKLSLSSC
jgi:hypothetical protein